MPVQIKVDIKNLEKIRSAFHKSPEVIGPFLREASMESALTVERKAKILSPVDTGRMRASIATSLGILNRGITSLVSTNVHYAIYVHEGTKRMRGRPFMKQAAEQSSDRIGRIFETKITEGLKKLANMAK